MSPEPNGSEFGGPILLVAPKVLSAAARNPATVRIPPSDSAACDECGRPLIRDSTVGKNQPETRSAASSAGPIGERLWELAHDIEKISARSMGNGGEGVRLILHPSSCFYSRLFNRKSFYPTFFPTMKLNHWWQMPSRLKEGNSDSIKSPLAVYAN